LKFGNEEEIGKAMSPAKTQRHQGSRGKKPRSKFEIRNSKQIQMIKNQKIQNTPVSDFVIWIQIFGFVSVRGASFDIRISDFVSLASWRDEFPWRRFV